MCPLKDNLRGYFMGYFKSPRYFENPRKNPKKWEKFGKLL